MTSTTPPVRPHRARRGEGERLRDELLQAAEALLVEKGSMDAVSMRAIAERTGVTPPSIYLHFDDKEELFFAVCEGRFLELANRFVNAVDGIDDPIEQLRTMGRAYVEWGLENPEHYAVLFGSGIGVPDGVDITQSPGRMALTAVVSVIERGARDGVLADGDPLATALMLWSTVHGFVHLVTHKAEFVPDIDLAAARDDVLDLAIRGIQR